MGFLTQNLGWKLLSLILAILLWLSISNERELASFVSAPIEYKAIPRDLEISSEVVESVYLELQGSESKLARFSASKSPVVLDLSFVTRPGEHTFHINQNNVNLPRGTKLIRAIPSQLRFVFDRRITRTVPVKVRFTGQPPKGYKVAREETHPSALDITGPEKRVQAVDAAVTDPIDLSGVIGIAEFHVNPFVADSHVRLVSPGMVTVKVYMAKS